MASAKATPEDVARLAALARINIPEADLPAIAAEFDSILAYIGQLDELSLDQDNKTGAAVANAFRIDGTPHEKGAWTEAIVAQFPRHEGDALSVKQIIAHD
jgi:aspartyl/glutamyl-tRNA(Asn/Gln) amidotransferase C subunit